jgi:hemolysin D
MSDSGTTSTHSLVPKAGRNTYSGLLSRSRLLSRTREDQEFLPAALEILETPPSPVQMWLLQAICAFVVIAITWMFIGKIDVIAVAQGKVQPTGRVKLVEPLDAGRVRELLVANGTKVEAGQAVVTLDDSETHAEELALAGLLDSLKAEMVRRAAAIEAAHNKDFKPSRADWPNDVPENILAREKRVLAGDLALLQSSVTSLAAQRQQKEAERERLTNTIASQEELLKIGEERLQLRSYLENQQLGSKLNVFDAQETLQNQRTSLAQQKGQLAETMASLNVLERDATKTIASFVAENGQKLADAERQTEDTIQKLTKARAKTSHMVLRAPVSGMVQALSITSPGQVLMPGEEVMRIVPNDTAIEIESYMPNKDIGFIKVGQEAVIKVESFPFTQYGSLPARVTRVSMEAIPEADAQQQEGNPARSNRSTLQAGAQRIQNLVFPVTLLLDKTTIRTDGGEIPVSNGMAVTVEIKTGYRRIIDYLFSPLIEVTSKAMKER